MDMMPTGDGAMGYSEAQFDPSKVDVSFASKAGTVNVCSKGKGIEFSEETASSILSEPEIEILVDLNEGKEECVCWGCDLTYDYVKINGDYRT